MKKNYTYQTFLIAIFLLISPLQFAQTNSQSVNNNNYSMLHSSATQLIKSEFISDNLNNQSLYAIENKTSLAVKPTGLKLYVKTPNTQIPLPEDFQTWESTKHFWIGVGEIGLLEFIPWAMAKWIRTWEDPSKNWANVSSKTWWRNLSNGWEYDGDSFVTNNYAHPYHGALFFSVGRTNGYNFWESTAWSLTGSAIWETFGETYRPAFNDWIYTGIGGANYGEILYRLSSLVTNNRATGSERFWSEFWGTLINPVRGFNRAISGEMGHNFDNPEWSRPKDFRLELDAGTRLMDINGDKQYKENELEGLFTMSISYGNPFKAVKPFEYFNFNFGYSSSIPHFSQLNSSGYLFGFNLQNNKHKFNVNLDFDYNNLIREQTSSTDTVYKGLLFGSTQIYPHLLSNFNIGNNTFLVTQIGINAMLMAATQDDYYKDVEGRIYDFGPGVGGRLSAAIRSNGWDYLRAFYYGAWMFTQSEPSDSKHNIHFLMLEAQYPFTTYFSVGVRAGVYWRESYYKNYPDVIRNYPMVRVFFRTAVVNF
jgi:hypothetical protein